MPLLEQEFNPAVAENLAELAEIARGEEDYWENEISGWMGTTVHWSQPDWARAAPRREPVLVQISRSGKSETPNLRKTDYDRLRSKIENAPWLVMNASVSRMWFLGGADRRAAQAGQGDRRECRDSAGVQTCGRNSALRRAGRRRRAKNCRFRCGWKLMREPEELIFVTPDLREPAPPHDYDYELPVPGRVIVCEAGSSIARAAYSGGCAAGV